MPKESQFPSLPVGRDLELYAMVQNAFESIQSLAAAIESFQDIVIALARHSGVTPEIYAALMQEHLLNANFGNSVAELVQASRKEKQEEKKDPASAGPGSENAVDHPAA